MEENGLFLSLQFYCRWKLTALSSSNKDIYKAESSMENECCVTKWRQSFACWTDCWNQWEGFAVFSRRGSDTGDAAFLPVCPFGGQRRHRLQRVNFDLGVRPGSAPICAIALLAEIWQALLSLSTQCKNKQQKRLELNSWKQVRQSHVNHQNPALRDPSVFSSLSSASFQAPPPAE